MLVADWQLLPERVRTSCERGSAARTKFASVNYQRLHCSDTQPCAQPDGPVHVFNLASVVSARRLAGTLGVMGKNLFDLRFVIKRNDGLRSSPWRLWITPPGDVYLTTRRMGGIKKYSFHKSGICRSAFTMEQGAPNTIADRAMFKWIRARTPAAGTGGASRVAWIAFPTDFLSRAPLAAGKKHLSIPAAAPGGATYVELAYTFESKEYALSAFEGNLRRLHAYTELLSGESFFVCSYHSDWENNDLASPPAPGSVFPELLFSAKDTRDTGRPIRLLFGPTPKDGDTLVLQELGGFNATNDA